MQDDKKTFNENMHFLESLPFRLRMQLIMFIYNDFHQNVPFLRNQGDSFFGWICPLLKQCYSATDQYIY